LWYYSFYIFLFLKGDMEKVLNPIYNSIQGHGHKVFNSKKEY
jgi:hypothetical protein